MLDIMLVGLILRITEPIFRQDEDDFMLPGEIITTAPKPTPKPAIIVWQEVCDREKDPPPLFCELPDERKIKTISYSGTPRVYASPYISNPSGSTSTTT
jgi:hypothetical protein